MADINELINTLRGNDELAKEFEAAWRNGASTQELADIIAKVDASVSADQLNELLMEMQAARGKSIATQELNDADLDAVAGGWDFFCSSDYYWCWYEYSCIAFNVR